MSRAVASALAADLPSVRVIRSAIVLLFLLMVAFALPQRAQANPSMEVGGIASFGVNGSNPPTAGTDWSIVRNGTTVATNLIPNGWSVGGALPAGGGLFVQPGSNSIVVGAPFSAAIPIPCASLS